MITITKDKSRIKPEAWDYPLTEIEYLIEEHAGETFVISDGRLWEAE